MFDSYTTRQYFHESYDRGKSNMVLAMGVKLKPTENC